MRSLLIRKIIFIHVPKTAGTSISQALEFKNSPHTTIQQVREELNWFKFYRSFKFAFVRNPWDRFLSLYNYARMPESKYHSAINPKQARYGKHLDYDLLKDASLKDCALYLLEDKLKHDRSWNHWLPQVNWILDKKGKIGVNFIGRYENLYNDFNEIQKKLNISVNLPRINSSNKEERPPYQFYYDEETKNIIQNYYKKDIALFNYEF